MADTARRRRDRAGLSVSEPLDHAQDYASGPAAALPVVEAAKAFIAALDCRKYPAAWNAAADAIGDLRAALAGPAGGVPMRCDHCDELLSGKEAYWSLRERRQDDGVYGTKRRYCSAMCVGLSFGMKLMPKEAFDA